MQPKIPTVNIPADNGVVLTYDPNEIKTSGLLSLRTASGGARVAGWFTREARAALRDALTASLEEYDRLADLAQAREEGWPETEVAALVAKGNGKATALAERLARYTEQTRVGPLTEEDGVRHRALLWWDSLSPVTQEECVRIMGETYQAIKRLEGRAS